MSRSVHVPWDESLIDYDFGHDHPLNPLRVDLTIRLARDLGVLSHAGVSVVAPALATDDELMLVHEKEYVDAVRAAGDDPHAADLSRGLGTTDTPAFRGMHEASAHVVGATLAAARAVWSGAAEHGVNVAGGLHHAMPGSGSGFCVYNDPAVAIAWLLEQGAERIAYVDVDVHHGDGVERTFWDEPRVLTVSLHESGRWLFPGTGFPDECGGPGAEGRAVNVALPPGTGDHAWLRAFHAVVPPLLAEFRPQVLVTQHGCDSHVMDPLAHLALTVDGQRTAAASLHDLAHRYSDGRWVACGGGGYELAQVVPRTWTHLLAEAVGHPVPPDTAVPEGWREYCVERYGLAAPQRMTDGGGTTWTDWDDGYDPADAVDRAVLATRRAVFPANGLGGLVDH